MGDAFGGHVVRAPLPIHGKIDEIRHSGQTVFHGINGPFKATRYHSLVVDRKTLPADLMVTAETADGLVMGLSHRSRPSHGVQFHPESIASEHGKTILRNFLDLAQIEPGVILQSGLVILGVSSFWQLIVVGAVLLVAVLLDRLTSLHRSRRAV